MLRQSQYESGEGLDIAFPFVGESQGHGFYSLAIEAKHTNRLATNQSGFPTEGQADQGACPGIVLVNLGRSARRASPFVARQDNIETDSSFSEFNALVLVSGNVEGVV